ncbi:MAG TPA: Photosystem I reaction center subunit III [Cyanobacteria bacterium UBA8543]|nr:Photosystem I reaction center subunit III [Cyanobacteria bacterium UBA8543]
MRRLLALFFAITLWFSCVPTASADVAGLVPCKESKAFQQRSKAAKDTIGDPKSGEDRFSRYSDYLCGPEGLPHLVADGSLTHADEFVIPGLIFLYIAGWIGWVGRAYLISVRKESSPEMKEIIIDVPRALAFMLSGFTWPLAAIKELLSGELTAKEEEIPVSPR